MVWESDAARGPLYKELPVAVREVCESHCFCNNASEFWQVCQTLNQACALVLRRGFDLCWDP